MWWGWDEREMWWGLEDIFLLLLDWYSPHFGFQHRNYHIHYFHLVDDHYTYPYQYPWRIVYPHHQHPWKWYQVCLGTLYRRQRLPIQLQYLDERHQIGFR
jgi:hypothetical protein